MINPEQNFGQIYDKYIEKIYRFVFVKVNSQEIAEDLTSQVFVKGWEVFKNRGGEIENPSAFLYEIARNLVTDHYREKGRTRFVSTDSGPQILDPRINLQEMAIVNADLNMVKKVLFSLKEEYQNVIIWHYLDGMPIKETAQMLNKTEGATRVLLSRALDSLRGKLLSD